MTWSLAHEVAREIDKSFRESELPIYDQYLALTPEKRKQLCEAIAETVGPPAEPGSSFIPGSWVNNLICQEFDAALEKINTYYQWLEEEQ